jgi:hypothetical protein
VQARAVRMKSPCHIGRLFLPARLLLGRESSGGARVPLGAYSTCICFEEDHHENRVFDKKHPRRFRSALAPESPSGFAFCVRRRLRRAAVANGTVMVSTGSGKVTEFNPTTGAMITQLDTGTGSTFTTGSMFDAAGIFYVTDFSTAAMTPRNTRESESGLPALPAEAEIIASGGKSRRRRVSWSFSMRSTL